MDVARLPFNEHLGLERPGDLAAPEQLLALPFAEHLLNHLGTLHASALYALAEASSGEFLIRNRGDREDIGGVVRRASSKYSAPATTGVTATSPTDPAAVTEAVADVDGKGRALVTIEIELTTDDGTVVGRFSFDWLLAKAPG